MDFLMNFLIDFSQILKLIELDLLQVNSQLKKALKSDVNLIQDIGDHIINSGGKRIRPVLVLLASKALGLQGIQPILTANIIELIHTATLLHDDVVDGSELRRGKPCANITFGNAASVLTGDFLYSRSFELMCELNNLPIMKVLAEASNKIAEGEVQQLEHCHNPEISRNIYFEIIYAKTAKLFEAACHVPAVLAQANPEITQAFINYGKYLGTAFQIIDDVIDYESDSDQMGKNMGDDLAEGKTTLPLIIAMEQGTQDQTNFIKNLIKTGDFKNNPENILNISKILKQTQALKISRELAKQEAMKALEALETLGQIQDSPLQINQDAQNAIQALQSLCELAWSRRA